MKSHLDHAKALLLKAEHDYKSAEIGMEHDAPLDTVAFHVQQTAERLIKALWSSYAVVPLLTPREEWNH